MKLAEASVVRADMVKRLEQHKARLPRDASVQEGAAPAEKPEEWASEFKSAASDFVTFRACINLTNATMPTGDRDLPKPWLNVMWCTCGRPFFYGQTGRIAESLVTVPPTQSSIS